MRTRCDEPASLCTRAHLRRRLAFCLLEVAEARRTAIGVDAVSERSKLTSSHLRRQAFVYLRQSSQAQLERNVESTQRQYALVERAIELGFSREQVVVIDEDLGICGSGLSDRRGSPGWRPRSRSGTPGWCSAWRSRRLAQTTTSTGIGCWICAA